MNFKSEIINQWRWSETVEIQSCRFARKPCIYMNIFKGEKCITSIKDKVKETLHVSECSEHSET